MTLDELLSMPPTQARAYMKSNPEERRRLWSELQMRLFKNPLNKRGKPTAHVTYQRGNVISLQEWKRCRNK